MQSRPTSDTTKSLVWPVLDITSQQAIINTSFRFHYILRVLNCSNYFNNNGNTYNGDRWHWIDSWKHNCVCLQYFYNALAVYLLHVFLPESISIIPIINAGYPSLWYLNMQRLFLETCDKGIQTCWEMFITWEYGMQQMKSSVLWLKETYINKDIIA